MLRSCEARNRKTLRRATAIVFSYRLHLAAYPPGLDSSRHANRQVCDGHHRQRLNKLLWDADWHRSLGGFHDDQEHIVIAAMFMFALTVGILTANLAESGNDRASGPTIGTLALQY